MEAILQFLNSAEKILLVAGVCLAIVGIVRPHQMWIIAIQWSWPRAAAAVSVGLVFVFLSLPQVRMWGVPDEKAPITRSEVKNLHALLTDARKAAHTGASTQPGSCPVRALSAQTSLDHAMRVLQPLKDWADTPPKPKQ